MSYSTDYAAIRLCCDWCGYYTNISEPSLAAVKRLARDHGWKLKRTCGGMDHGEAMCPNCVEKQARKKAKC